MNTLSRLLILLTLVLAACADPDAVSTSITDPSAQVPPADDTAAEAQTSIVEIDPVPGTAQDEQTGDTVDGEIEPVPMPVEGDGGIGDGAGPPDENADPMAPPAFGVSSETESLSVDPVSYCWNTSEQMGVCADGVPSEPLPAISADSQLVVTFAVGQLRATVDGDIAVPVVMENPGIYLVDLSSLVADSTYELSLGFNGDDGSASAYADLTIVRQ